MNEKKDELQQNPEKYWAEVIKTNKFNINGEKANIEKYTAGRELLDRQIKETERGLALDFEETELIKKLYPKHGKDYENTEEFKKFFTKKLDFILNNIKNKEKAARRQYSYQIKSSVRSISEAERMIKQYRKNIKEAKAKQKEALKDKDKMFG